MIIHQVSVTEQIVEYFKENIQNGTWKIGEKIPSENQLTTSLGVSRASVRSAVSKLAGIGVLESVHGKGTFLINADLDNDLNNENKITSEDCQDLEKVLEFRRIVESEACYMATRNQTSELLDDLQRFYETMSQSKNKDTAFIQADIQFHQAICRASKNPLLEKSMNKVFEENRRSQKVSHKIFGYQDGVYYHGRILSAMEVGDAERAKVYMYEHLQNAINRLPK